MDYKIFHSLNFIGLIMNISVITDVTIIMKTEIGMFKFSKI